MSPLPSWVRPDPSLCQNTWPSPTRGPYDMPNLDLPVGTRFDTEFETGCVVTIPPGDEELGAGNFLALDTEGVECLFHVQMITEVQP